MLPYKIAITGRFRTGKDTLADILQELIEQEGGEVTRLSFAAALKSEVSTMCFNFVQPEHMVEIKELDQGEGLPTYGAVYAKKGAYPEWEASMRTERQLNGLAWQWWGEWRRQHNGADYWIVHPLFRGAYLEAEQLGESIIVSDMRHHNEAKWCQENGFYLIRVAGPCRAEGEVRDRNHPSEIHVDELEVDYVIGNGDTVEDLKERVQKRLMPKLKDRAEAVDHMERRLKEHESLFRTEK